MCTKPYISEHIREKERRNIYCMYNSEVVRYHNCTKYKKAQKIKCQGVSSKPLFPGSQWVRWGCNLLSTSISNQALSLVRCALSFFQVIFCAATCFPGKHLEICPLHLLMSSVIFFLNVYILSDCSNILCPLPCIDTCNVSMWLNRSAKYATHMSLILSWNSSAHRELFSQESGFFCFQFATPWQILLDSQHTSEWHNTFMCSEPKSFHRFEKLWLFLALHLMLFTSLNTSFRASSSTDTIFLVTSDSWCNKAVH